MEAAMSEWLDLELSEQLAPVTAPDQLWNRVCAAQAPARPAPRFFALPVAAVVTLILAGALWFMARGQQQSTSIRQFSSPSHSECLLCHTTI
jgi:hypothetical protein